MLVGSYLEMYTSIFGWLLYDNVWSVLSETGLAYIPFFTVIIKNFAEPYKSQEAKDAASVSQRRMELDLISMFVAVIFVVSPMMNLTVAGQTYKEVCAGTVAVTGGASGTTYDASFSTAVLGGSVAKVPLWWMMVMNLSGALNETVIAGVNCSVNVRQLKYEINNIQIQDKGLVADLSRFHNECYLEALAKSEEDPNAEQTLFDTFTFNTKDRDWMGSTFFTTTAGYYDSFRAATPVTGFAYNAARDIEYDPAVGTPANGRPTCKNWWTNGTNGLNKRLNNEIPAAKNVKLGNFGALFGNTLATERENAVKTVLLNSNVVSDSIDRIQLNGLATSGDVGFGNLGAPLAKRALGTITTGTAWAFVETTLITIQNMAPNLQALILMTVYFLLPFVFVMGSYQWQVIITATFVVFGIRFLTTIFAVLIYLDAALYSAINKAAINNIQSSLETKAVGGGVADLTIAAMWIIMPGLWMGMIGWAGFKAASSVSTGSSEAKKTGDTGTSETKSLGGKGVSKG